jgi:colicin import membrane protein
VNLRSLTAEVMAQPLDQFTAHRNARVKELKASGQADLSRQLGALKKPAVHLWAANQVRDRALLSGLRRAAQAVAKAQAAAATRGPNAAQDLRAASEEFQRTIESVATASMGPLRQGQHAAAEETMRRIREIFRLAALQGGDTWDRLQEGALTTEPSPADDLIEMFAAGAIPGTGRRAEQAEARRAAELAEKAARADAGRAQQAIAAAERRRQEAKEAAVAARLAAERAAAADKEAARARAQAKKSQRGTNRRDPG